MQTLYFAWLGQKEKLHYTFKEIKIFIIRIKMLYGKDMERKMRISIVIAASFPILVKNISNIMNYSS
jgi:hypothetical protein